MGKQQETGKRLRPEDQDRSGQRASEQKEKRTGGIPARLGILAAVILLCLAALLIFFFAGRSGDEAVEEIEQRETQTADLAVEEPEVASDEPEETIADEIPTDEAVLPKEEPEDAAQPEEDPVQTWMDTMTLREKVLQMFMVTPEQLTGVDNVTRAGETTRQALEIWPVGGVVYFASNLETPDQVREMLSGIQSYAEYGLFLAVDEEGGSVARLGNNDAMGTTQFPAMGTIGASGDLSEAYRVGLTIGSELAEFGFILDFAPVADVNTAPSTSGIGTRAFSDDAETAAAMVSSCVEGFQKSGTQGHLSSTFSSKKAIFPKKIIKLRD